jgi:hypothetical protein
MPARWLFSAHVAAPPDEVFRWMSDFREDDHSRPAYLRGAGVDPSKARVSSKRTVLSREGNVIRLLDEWDGRSFKATVTLAPERREVVIEGGFGYRATWRAAPEGEGSRVECAGEFGAKGIMRLVAPLFARSFEREMRKDFDGHVADLRETLASVGARDQTA